MRRAAPLALCALIAFGAQAKQREGVTAEPTIEVGGKQLHLMGMGLRKKLWFKVYIASLYLEDGKSNAEQAVSTDQTRRVVMQMLRDLERGKIVEAVNDGFSKNAGKDMPKLKERLDRFTKAIPDLKSGQRIVITYLPGKGTTVKAGNGEEVHIDGKDFADALFSVWLGKHPVDDGLKHEMLTNK